MQRLNVLYYIVLGGGIAFALWLGSTMTEDAKPVTEREFLVATSASLDAATLQRRLHKLSAKVSPLKALAGTIFVVKVVSNREDAEIMAMIEQVPGVETVEPNAKVRIQ